MKYMIFLTVLTLCLGACSTLQNDSATDSGTSPDAVAARKSGMPAARIYKLDERYADLVPVVMIDGRLTWYPAPTDIRESTAPLKLTDGWWLDRQGISVNTSFLNWNRQEYSKFETTPTPAEIKAAIVPGARISELYELPMTTTSASNDTVAVNSLIKKGLPGCTSLLPVYTIK